MSLADKLDTLTGMFYAGEKPTGSRDPFGLRRQAHGLLKVLLDLHALTGLPARPRLAELLEEAAAAFAPLNEWPQEHRAALHAFLLERYRYVLEQRGFDVRNVRAVLQESGFDALSPADALGRLEALPEFTSSPDFQKLAVAFKRVKNIARELPDTEFLAAEHEGPALGDLLKEPAERALVDELEKRAPVIDSVLKSGENLRRAFVEAAQFGPAVDRFFTEIFVMVEDQTLRKARLRLMSIVAFASDGITLMRNPPVIIVGESDVRSMNLDKIPHDRAAFGSTVQMIEDNGEKVTYQLVMPEEADAAKGLISTSSPIGRAIVGKTEGDEIKVVTPNGTRQFEITKLVTIHDEA